MKRFSCLVALVLVAGNLFAANFAGSKEKEPAKPAPPPPHLSVTFREARYDGKLSDSDARFAAEFDIEATGKGDAAAALLDGDVAMLTTKLPEHLTLGRDGTRYALRIAKEGRYKLKLDLLAKITKAEPWNQISFTGPPAVIASVNANVTGEGVEVQLLKGTVAESGGGKIKGILAADQTVSLRWQSKAAEIARKALLTCDSAATIQITPTVVKYNTALRYEIVQGSVTKLQVSLPANQALTKLQGENIRDWQIKNADQNSASRIVRVSPDPARGELAVGGSGAVGRPAPNEQAAKTAAGEQILNIEFVRPVEKNYSLVLFSEQTVESATATLRVAPPQPLDVERESGAMTVSAEDVVVETEKAEGLRQVNATAGAFAAFQFHARPVSLALKLRRIEPVVTVADRVTARLEESRLAVYHSMAVTVEKAGIYTLEMSLPAGFVAAEVRGEGVEDWKSSGGKLSVTFVNRVLGRRALDVLLEQILATPVGADFIRDQTAEKSRLQTAPTNTVRNISILPMRVTGASKETTQIGAAAAAGIQLKTAADGMTGLRETPINALPNRYDEMLAFNAEQADWKLTLAAERLTARVVADIFNLVTVGDGVVGGSATIRFAILNQGAQEFRVKLPALWKNIEFTGPNIRRKEQQGDGWLIALQEKAWGGYTLVVTYDMQFDPHKAALPVGGIHCLGIERESGSIAITSATNLQIAEGKKSAGVETNATSAGVVRGSPDPARGTVGDLAVGTGGAVGRPAPNESSGNVPATMTTVRRIDESELAAHDRALITRPVLLAYQYTGNNYEIITEVTRFDELPVLEAVADRTQLTTVLTEDGQTLTQASFLVKNNDKQFQSFTLPPGAELWSCYVRGEPAKPERSGDKLLVPLPRGANRDEAFAVDIVYKKSVGSLKTLWRGIEMVAPVTDMQTTYAEWELYVPTTTRLAGFGGNMIVARGTEYGLRDAWRDFVKFYDEKFMELLPFIIIGAVLFVIVFLVAVAFRRGWRGALIAVSVLVVCGLLTMMLLPLTCATRKAARMSYDRQQEVHAEMDSLKRDERGTRSAGDSLVKREVAKDLDKKSAERLEELKVQAAKPGFVGTPIPVKARNLEQRAGEGDLRDRAAREGVVVLGGTATYADLTPGKAGATDLGLGLNATATAAAVAGLRPIRIDIPKTGARFVFTKVLNVRSEPLSVTATAMDNDAFKVARGAAQATVFVAGLALLWWQWRAARRRAFALALGLTLALGGVGALLLSARLLDAAMILVAPMIGLAALGWLTRKIWRAIPVKAKKIAASPVSTPPSAPPPVPPVVTALLALALVAASNARAEQDLAATIVSATYTGVVMETKTPSETRGVAVFDAVFELNATTTNQTVRLFGEDVAVQEFSGPKAVEKRGWFSRREEPVSAQLVRDGKTVGVLLTEKGAATVRVKFLVKLGGDVTRRQLTFAIPPALVSRLSATLEDPQAVVELPTAVSFTVTNLAAKTQVAAVIGSGERVELSWTPRTKRAAEIAATVFCQNTSLASFGGGVLNVRSALDYQVTQGELRQMRVRVPAGQRLMRVEGDQIRTWRLDTENGAQFASVELVKGVSPVYRLTVETEKPMDGPVAVENRSHIIMKVEAPHAADVKRETGIVAMKASDELSVSPETTTGLQKVDATEVGRTLSPERNRENTGGATSAYRFLKPDFELTVRVEAVQPQIEAAVRNLVRVNTESLLLTATVDYLIKRTGVFTLRLALPPEYRVERVVGQNVAQHVEKAPAKTGEPRLLEVTLKQRMTGAYSLQIFLRRALAALPRKLEIVGVQPLDTQKLTGFVCVNSEEGVQVKSESFDGVTEIPSAMIADWVGRTGNALAYKLIPGENGVAAGWKLTASTERIDSWVRAEVMNWTSVTETLLSGRSIVRYEIQNAPTKEFRVKVPAAWRNVEVNGADIRRKDRDEATGEWRVELQNKVRGAYTLVVTWERPWDVKDGAFEMPGVEVVGVERETGTLAVLAQPSLKIEPKETSVELQRIDRRELPGWAEAGAQTPTLAFRYLRPGYKLTLATQRFDDAEVLQAWVDRVNLTTVVSEDGQMMTEMNLAIRNNARQYLEVTLPASATNVWSAFVAGQPVRPSVRGGKLLLPLERSGADGAPVTVELTYISGDKFPRARGAVALESPALDVPFGNGRWDLYLPPDYNYNNFEGTMRRELLSVVAAATRPVVELFSLGDYTVAESRNKAARIAEEQLSISNVKAQLKSGKLNEAAQGWNRYRGGKVAVTVEDTRANEEAKEVEKEIRKAKGQQILQGNQMITGNAYYNYNANASQLNFADNNAYTGSTTINNGALVVNQSAAQTDAFYAQQQRAAAPQQQAAPQGDNNNLGWQFNAADAEQQAEKVAKAQEITVAKALPLRVNLPKRGIHLGFTQTLQTDVRKPMTLQFDAAAGKDLGIMTAAGLGVAGLLALWGLLRFVVRRNKTA